MPNSRARIEREKKTIQHMIGIYCHGRRHAAGKVCGKCWHLLRYAVKCIDACPYKGGGKPVCGICPSHCFDPAIRREFNHVMRYAGPRMMIFHPVLTTLHFLDALRKTRTTATIGA